MELAGWVSELNPGTLQMLQVDLFRELEHYRDGKKFTHMKVNGKAKTLQGALKEEKKTLGTYRKNHKGKNPKYNKTDRG